MFRQIKVSAPSKVILHGEHAVVYGKSAIAGSLDLRTRMCLTPLQENVLEVDFPDVGVKKQWKSKEIKERILYKRPKTLHNQIEDLDSDFLQCIETFLAQGDFNKNEFQKSSLLCFFYLYSMLCDKFVSLQIKVESEIPLGAGLGSSAALSVCLAAGLYALKDPKMDEEALDQICRYAFLSEKILHGNPSGIDNAVSTYGGFIHFKKQGLTSKIVPIDCSNCDLRILLVNTKVPRSTKTMVQNVKNSYHEYPEVIGPTLDAIDGLTKKCLEVLQNDQETNKTRTISQLVDYNQKLLETLGVSHPALEDVVQLAKTSGFSAKLTGAGGGGFAMIVISNAEETILNEIKEKLAKNGYDSYETSIGVDGVRVSIENVCISQ